MLTQEKVKELFEYKDGGLYWKETSRNKKAVAGNRYGYISQRNYRQGHVGSMMWREHRLIFLFHYGYLPKYLDHKDGDTLNNSIDNLRPATLAENACNKKRYKNNTSGNQGVYWNKKLSKWSVHIQANKKQLYFGLFEDLELACLVADEARDKYHGVFASTRRVSNELL